MKREILVVGLGLLLAGSAYANFKFEGVGARALGMGSAFVAISDDASSPYYNPAGLIRVDGREEMYMYGQKLEGITYQYVGLIWKNTGFSYLNQSGDLQKAENMRSEKAGESVYSVSYAKGIGDTWAVGGSLKILSLSNEWRPGSGFGIDIGMLYTPDIPEELSIGFVIRDLGSEIQDEPLDTSFVLGAAIKWSPKRFWKGLRVGGLGQAYNDGFRIKKEILEISEKERVCGDWLLPENGFMLMSLEVYSKEGYGTDERECGYNIGAETRLFDILFARIGLSDGDFTTGIGLWHNKWRLDYAYLAGDMIDSFDNHYISLTMSF
jgi:hypothetical protein